MREKKKIEKGEEKLYHYTSMAALYGILKNKEFWFGNAASMNDTSEITDFIEKFLSALKASVPEENYNSFREEMYAELNSDYPYIMSFSTLEEDAAQWERYADNARGVCIVFDRNTIDLLLRYNVMMFNNVYYDYDVNNHENLKNAIKICNGEKVYIEVSHDEWTKEDVIYNTICCASLFKNKSFKSECENRGVILKNRIHFNKYITESFELINGNIRKVCKLDVDGLCKNEDTFDISFEDLFESIVIGPCSTQSVEELREFIESCGLPNLAKKITKSICPLKPKKL